MRHALTARTVRFVDRDMFMRYRGGGIGHRYMREIEDIYENMSRERVHHKENKHLSSNDPTNVDTVGDSGSDDDGNETEASQAVGGSDSNSNSNSDYSRPGTDSEDSHFSGDSDTEEFDSEGEVVDSYGLSDL